MLGLYNTSDRLKKMTKMARFVQNRAIFDVKSWIGRRLVDWENLAIMKSLGPKGFGAFFGRHLVDTSPQVSYSWACETESGGGAAGPVRAVWTGRIVYSLNGRMVYSFQDKMKDKNSTQKRE